MKMGIPPTLEETAILVAAADPEGNIVHWSIDSFFDEMKSNAEPCNMPDEGHRKSYKFVDMVLRDTNILKKITNYTPFEKVRNIKFKRGRDIKGIEMLILDKMNRIYLVEFMGATTQNRKSIHTEKRRIRQKFEYVRDVIHEMYPPIQIYKYILVYRQEGNIQVKEYSINASDTNR